MRTALVRAVAFAAWAPLVLGGCASMYLRHAPPSPREPWPIAAETARPSETTPDGSPAVASGHVYTLAELIDLAESTNPDTRIGWQRARQAALAVGIPMAGYFPKVEALTFIWYQHTIIQASDASKALIGANPSAQLPTVSVPVPMPPTPSGSVGVDTFQVMPFVLVTLELLNLARASEVRGAKESSTAANAQFTAEHERIIFEVARAYFRLNAARTQQAVSREALDRTRAIAKAAEARFAQGLANAVERSQAQRELAQAEYLVTQTLSLEVAAHAVLVSALGIEPRAPLDVVANPSAPLPSRLERNVDTYIEQALSTRADLRAARAQLPAKGAGVSKVNAAYAPRINVFGTAGGAILGGRAESNELPTLNLPIFTAGINFSWNLFDGGLREVQGAMARAAYAESQEQLRKLHNQVVQEVVTAYNEVNASLSRYQSATALLETAVTAEDAATKSYLNGLATLTEAMNAQKGRAQASAAKEQAFADALVATTTLAFATGELLSAKAIPQSP